MTKITCPQCGNQFDVKLSDSMPFCSRYCQRADLNNWLNEDYGMPQEDLIADNLEREGSNEVEDPNQ